MLTIVTPRNFDIPRGGWEYNRVHSYDGRDSAGQPTITSPTHSVHVKCCVGGGERAGDEEGAAAKRTKRELLTVIIYRRCEWDPSRWGERDGPSASRGGRGGRDKGRDKVGQRERLEGKEGNTLGVHTIVMGDQRRHQKYRSQKARAAWEVVRRLSRLPAAGKRKIVIQQILPILRYGCELYPSSKRDWQRKYNDGW